MDTVNVFVFPVYRIIAVDNSVIIVTQLNIAPDTIPLAIMGMVMAKNVFILEVPRLMDASSMVMGICCKIATLDRMV